MSDFTVIRAVTETLKALLEEHITNSSEPQLNGVAIDLRSPKEMREDVGSGVMGARGVSLWLYQVSRNADLLNHPPRRVDDRLERHPIPINLCYLLTPIMNDPLDEQTLLGRALQVFNDHGTVAGATLQGSLAGGSEKLRLNLEPLSLEELTRVWDALKESYQLSVGYLVQAVSIDSDHEPVGVSPVLVRHNHYAQITSVEP